jgi:acyl-homoserine lactone acylase PvdQ
VTDQVALIQQVYGEVGEQIIADAQAYVDGYNAYLDSARAITRIRSTSTM